MTILIADNSPRTSYTATSNQTAFTVPFEFFDNTDLNVYINDTLQTLTTHYEVTGGSGSTGSITLTTGATAGDVIVITRNVTLERTTDFPTSGPFQVASLNTELDKVVAMIADMKDLADRGLRMEDFDTTVSLTIPSKDNRKGTVLAFNATTGAVEVGPTIADTNTVAQIKADIATVAGISSQVTTVSGISGNVTTVADNDTNVTTVAGNITNVNTVAGDTTEINTVAGDTTEINALSAVTTEIGLLGNASVITDMSILGTADVVADMNTLGTADVVADMNTLGTADVVADMNTLATTEIVADMDTLADISTDITAVADISTDVTAVAGDATDIGTVAGISANVTTVAGNNTNVTTVAGISSDVTTVAGISANVTTVAGDSSDIQTVAGNTTNINTVAGANANISTVATDIANVNTTAANITGVNSFAERYRVGSSDPTTSLDEGDLAYNTTDNALKYYNGTSWSSITAGLGNIVEDATPQLGGNLDLNSNDITGTGNFNITGNFALSGTVDGRDVATDGAKLDGIEANATADQTKADIDALGIDAATLDSIDSTSFLRSDADDSASGDLSFSGMVTVTGPGYPILRLSSGGTSNPSRLQFGTTSDADHGEIFYTPSTSEMLFKVNNTDRFELTSSGANLTGDLDVTGDITDYRKVKYYEFSSTTANSSLIRLQLSDSTDVKKLVINIGQFGTNGGPYSPSFIIKTCTTGSCAPVYFNLHTIETYMNNGAVNVDYNGQTSDIWANLSNYSTSQTGQYVVTKTGSGKWMLESSWMTGAGTYAYYNQQLGTPYGSAGKIGCLEFRTNGSYVYTSYDVRVWEYY